MTREMLLNTKVIEIGDEFALKGKILVIEESRLMANLCIQYENACAQLDMLSSPGDASHRSSILNISIDDHIYFAMISCIATHMSLDVDNEEWPTFPNLHFPPDVSKHLRGLAYSKHLRVRVKEIFEEMFTRTTFELYEKGLQLLATSHLMYDRYYKEE